jgi:AcrR family transcriptional regulator
MRTNMARPSKLVRDKHINETRDQLLQAAALEFAQEGYVGANINRISCSAGFAKGTIYNYFPSKRALMCALIEEIAVPHVAFILDRVEKENDHYERLKCFFRAGFTFVEKNPIQARVIINAVYGPDPEFRNQVYKVYEQLFHLLFNRIIEAGIASGDFRPVDVDFATALIMTVYLGSCSQVDDNGKIWLDPEQVARFVLDGLRSR